MKTALITGITGQDGSYLAEQLLEKNYVVYGIIRRSSSFNTKRIEHIYKDPHDGTRLHLVYGDLSDAISIAKLIDKVEPDEVYNLGAQSHVRVSFDSPDYSCDIDGIGCLRMLESVRMTSAKIRFYQASTSEMYGDTPPPQSESSTFNPRSPYACSKLFAYNLVRMYREAYGMHASNGILFNHESPRRGETFVSRKITRAATRIKAGFKEKLYLGNTGALRDWGYAPEYVDAMWRMLQQDAPGDYVIATSEMHSVQEFLEETFGMLSLDYRDHVEHDWRYHRPLEVNRLCGDYSKAKSILKWEPKTKFRELVREMVNADLSLAEKEMFYRRRGECDEKISKA